MTTNEQHRQGSNAERAEGGLNPEASFAELDKTTAARMATQTDSSVVRSVKQQLEQAPGGKGDVANRP